MICEPNDLLVHQDSTEYMESEKSLLTVRFEQPIHKKESNAHFKAINKEIVIKEKELEVSNHESDSDLLKSGASSSSTSERDEIIDKAVILEAHKAYEEAKGDKKRGHNGILCGAALRLPNGEIITGTNSPLFHSASVVIIKACKSLVGLPADVFLLSSVVIDSIGKMKQATYQPDQPSLNVTELLIALAVEGPMNPSISKIIEMFPKFKGCEMYLTHIPTLGDQSGLKKLGINFSYDPISASQD